MPPYQAPPSRYEGVPRRFFLPAGARLTRIHSAAFGVVEFNPTVARSDLRGGRFDSTPGDDSAFLYAADHDPTAVSEVLLRDLPIDDYGARLLPRVRLSELRIGWFSTTLELELVSLRSGVDLAALGQDSWLTTASAADYAMTRRWSSANRLGSSRGIAADRGWRPAEWTGRALILGAVAFWWGLIVVPRLVSLAFPELLSFDAIPRHLDPDKERTVANAVSAASLLIVALLAFAMVRQAHHARSYWITTGGWAVLAVTAAYLAWEEFSEFHVSGTRDLGDVMLGSSNLPWLWPVVLSPLIVAFVLAMAVFVRKGLPSTGSTGPSAKLSTGSRQASSGREVRAADSRPCRLAAGGRI